MLTSILNLDILKYLIDENGESSNGRTADSGSVCGGSNPSSPALFYFIIYLYVNTCQVIPYNFFTGYIINKWTNR